MNTENKTYNCALCGKSYSNIIDRITCEQKCYTKQQEEAKKAAEAKKQAEKITRKKEVDDAIDKAMRLRNAYIKDYNCYVYDNNDVHNEFNIDNYPSLKELINFLM